VRKYNNGFDEKISLQGSINLYEKLIKERGLGASAIKRLSQLKTKLRLKKMRKSGLYQRIMKRDAIKNGL
tara:strand:- start:16412 stop:16621 length:210 start_codon:yes stop_codon:yes gene_type:complete